MVTGDRIDTAEGPAWVMPGDLVCPRCDERVHPAPPVYWELAWGLPVVEFSHPDGSPLCGSRGSGVPAGPVERER